MAYGVGVVSDWLYANCGKVLVATLVFLAALHFYAWRARDQEPCKDFKILFGSCNNTHEMVITGDVVLCKCKAAP